MLKQATFERVRIKKSETKTVRFKLDDRALSIVNGEGMRQLVPGKIDQWIGGGQPVSRPGLSQSARADISMNLTAAATLPE